MLEFLQELELMFGTSKSVEQQIDLTLQLNHVHDQQSLKLMQGFVEITFVNHC